MISDTTCDKVSLIPEAVCGSIIVKGKQKWKFMHRKIWLAEILVGNLGSAHKQMKLE